MIVLLAFMLMIAGMPWFIRSMRKMQIGEMVREEGPKTHMSKTGTPTMGGLFLIACVGVCMGVTILFYKKPFSEGLWLTYLMLAYGLMGFMDDFRKIVRKSPYGLKARENIILQIVFALPFLWILWNSFNLSYPLILFIMFELLVILSVTNSVNLTDGLDGLLSGIAIPIFVFYFFYGQVHSFPVISQFALVFTGALLGFLFYNTYPAKIFMGNVGSFAIGGVIAGMAVITGTEWLLLILGAIFVLEALSVIIQVGWFKYTRKKTGEGRRIFRMAPIHHHFELAGYPEPLIVVRFWIAQLVLTIVAWFIAVQLF